ncbi:MAG: AAA family ATPase [Myxococcaceae bacterium]|nr:AAA family ATPase [Myxococcaceae bacterium]MBH2005814.1 AAA family ATPase [Myxococcaceae bacterium]
MKDYILAILLFLGSSSLLRAKTISVSYGGTSDFKKLALEGKRFVDKTLFIKSLLQGKEVTLITRPRRWGKSTNMDMLKYFFKEEMDEKGQRLDPQPYRRLFENLKISQEPGFIGQYQGQYPTLLLNLQTVKAPTYARMQTALEWVIVRLFAEYRYLDQISDWWESSRRKEADFLEKIREKVIQSPTIGLGGSLITLGDWLYAHHGKGVYILIDEYDTPINEASEHGYAKEAIQLLRSFLTPALKGNPSLEKAVLTGILRVGGVNLFSGLNNFAEDSLFSNRYSPYYGFTEEEVDELLVKAQRDNKAEVKEWYNGYNIGGITIYNPWSISHYLDNGELGIYWVASGTTQLIDRALVSEDIQEDLAKLRNREIIRKSFDKNIDFFKFEQDPKALWPLLLYAGYLTVVDCQQGRETSGIVCDLKIPNREIACAYGDFLESLLTKKRLPRLEELDGVGYIFEAVSRKDSAQLESLFEKHGTVAFSDEWNFNFLQMAILTGDESVFKTVYQRYNDSSSLIMLSKEGLSLADFASLAGVYYEEDLKEIDRNFGDWRGLERLCWLEPTLLGGSLGVLSWVYQQLAASPKRRGRPPAVTTWQNLRKVASLVLAPGTGATVGALVEGFLEPSCQNYRRYQNTNIARSRTLNRWIQFAKFVDQNPGSYMRVGSMCGSGDRKILDFKQAPFSSYIPSKGFDFVLCIKP